MRNLKYLFLLALVVGLVFSCKKDDEEDTVDNGTEVENVEKSTISAKWEVEGDSDYDSFEFNESGTYVVVRSSPDKETEEDILFGTYTIDGDLLILSNFGTIKVMSLTEQEMTFAIKLLGQSDYGDTLTANKSEELPPSSNTQLLCRTWKMFSINNDTVAGTEDELYVVFYQSGTYVVTYVGEDELGDVAQWKWFDSQENVICYSWDGEPDCTDVVEVVSLDEYKLELQEEGSYYVLYPLNSSKSSQAFNVNNETFSEIKAGNFFNKK